MIVIGIAILIIIVILVWAHGEGVPVFLYHEVRENSGTSPTLLKEEMAFLRSKNVMSFNFSSAKKYIDEHGKLPRNSVIITFDDGYEDNYSLAYPILKKYDMAATIFVNSGFVEKKSEYLTFDQMKEMYPLVDVQTHTEYHNKNFSSTKLIGIYDVVGELKNGIDNIYGMPREKGFPIFEYGGEVTHRKVQISSNIYKDFQKYYLDHLSTRLQEDLVILGQKFVNSKVDVSVERESDEVWRERVMAAYYSNKRALEQGSGQHVEHFAWPWGFYNKKTHKWLKEAGVIGFATCIRGTNARKLNFEWIRRNSIQNANIKKFRLRYFITKNLILGWLYEKVSTKNAKWEIKE